MKNILVRAGAGAGKTTRLTTEVFELANTFKKNHQRFPNLVVTTFTRKATQELRERLILKACENQELDLIDYASNPISLNITTIHGLLGQFLRKYSHLLDFDNSFTIMSQTQVQVVVKKYLRELVQQNNKYYQLVDIYGYQTLSDLIHQFYKEYTFNLNLQPMKSEDFESALNLKCQNLSQQLFASVAKIEQEAETEKWLNWAHQLKDIAGAMATVDHKAMLQAWDRLSTKPRVSKNNPALSESTESEVKIIRDEVKKFITGSDFNFEDWDRSEKMGQLFHQLGQQFSEKLMDYKKSTGQLEMVDYELLTWKAIQEKPEIAQAFSEEWDYWLVDEYQDTSPIQVELLKHLIGSSKSFTVGDPQQSIYLFRGADFTVFEKKQKEVQSKNGQLDYQITNYRSEPELLEFFNDYFSRLTGFEKMQPRQKISDSSKVVAQICINSEESTVFDEMDAIASYIGQLINTGSRFDDICILGRTNKVLTETALYLQKYNIPTHVHSSSGFSKRREVLDFLFLLKFLINPHDNENFVGLVRSPWFYLDESDFEKVIDIYDQKSFWMQFKNFEEEFSSMNHLKQCIKLSLEIGVIEAAKIFLIERAFIDVSLQYDPTGRRESNIWKLIHKLSTDQGKPGFNVLDYVNSTLDTIGEEGGDDSDAVAALEPNRVNLMTIHSSKGLQFNHVLLPFMGKAPNKNKNKRNTFVCDSTTGKYGLALPVGEEEKQTLPISCKEIIEQEKQKELQEGDRVLYVALTRAKKSIFLSWNEKVGKDSWAERVNLPVENSLYKTSNYSYKVETGPWQPEVLSAQVDNKSTLRSLFKEVNEEVFKKEKVSVSSLLKEGDFFSLEKTKNNLEESILKTQFGVSLHYCMEILKQNFDFDFTQLMDSNFDHHPELITKAIDYVKSLQSPNMKEVITNGEVEWGFQFLENNQIIEGQIDLWGKDSHGIVWVIDYKSGSPKYSDRAFAQLYIYAKALKNYGVSGDMKLAVIYPMQQQVKVKNFNLS